MHKKIRKKLGLPGPGLPAQNTKLQVQQGHFQSQIVAFSVRKSGGSRKESHANRGKTNSTGEATTTRGNRLDDAMAHDAHDGYAQNRGALLSGMKAAEAIHHGLNNLLS